MFPMCCSYHSLFLTSLNCHDLFLFHNLSPQWRYRQNDLKIQNLKQTLKNWKLKKGCQRKPIPKMTKTQRSKKLYTESYKLNITNRSKRGYNLYIFWRVIMYCCRNCTRYPHHGKKMSIKKIIKNKRTFLYTE